MVGILCGLPELPFSRSHTIVRQSRVSFPPTFGYNTQYGLIFGVMEDEG